MSLKEVNDLPLFSQKPKEAAVVALGPKPWTITELTTQIRSVLEPSFSQVWIQGEVSNYRPAPSGHAYFSLKDQGASISAAIFSWGARKKSFDLKDGLQVLCRGKISIYPPRGNYQLIIDTIEPLGAGALQVAFEQLKLKLAGEGLFDQKRKRELPRFPTRLAIITSPSGAAIHDMLNILKRRAPHIEVRVIPALVQGEDAANQLIRAVELVNQYRLGDLIILARGGGSIEDLWSFNHEGLARAIVASSLPVISAVGHEVDFTISDFVADLRAPTPSAAAEIVSGHWVEAVHRQRDLSLRLQQSILKDLLNRKTLLAHIVARVISPRDRLREQIQRTDELVLRLERAIRVRLERQRATLERSIGKLDALSPLRVLKRGYALVRESGEKGLVVKSAHQVQSGKELIITFHDGQKVVQTL